MLFTFYSCLDALSFAFYILLCFFLFDGQTVMVCALQARWPLSCCLRSRQASPDWHSTYGPSPDVQCRCAHSIRGLTVTRRAHPAPGGAAPLDPPYRLRLMMLQSPAFTARQGRRRGPPGSFRLWKPRACVASQAIAGFRARGPTYIDDLRKRVTFVVNQECGGGIVRPCSNLAR